MVLEIILADHAGFCFGVKRATDLATNLAKEAEQQLSTLGPLIHNPQVVERLEEMGIRAIDDLDNIDEGTVMIRSHGVPPDVIENIKEKGLDIVDATCPFVSRAQEYAKQLAEEEYQVIICGDQNHPEVIGILGSVNYDALVVKTIEELEQHRLKRKVGVIAQTTLPIGTFKRLIAHLLDRVRDLKIFNTICTTTEERQTAASELAEKVDLMLVIGGKNSANTNRLAEICRNKGVTTYHVETADELKEKWFDGVDRVGVTAGASTPNWIIKEVIGKMSEEKKVVNEENTEAVSEETQVDQEQMMKEHAMADLKVGDKVTGTVVEVKKDSVYVSVGHKSEGVIPLNELTNEDVESAKEIMNEGDEIDVVVVGLEDEEGNIRLSRKNALREEAWESIIDSYENNEIIEAKVSRVVKGGLVVNIGLRGFVPASHIAIEYVENLEQFVGQTLRFKVIEVDRDNNNVVLSRKAVLEEEREAEKKETLAKLEAGQEIEGKVTKIVDFGAFVDLGGIEGLLHISEMSWGRIDHPSEVVNEGDTITVKVLNLDIEKERIALGLKQTQPDPWETFAEKHHEGEVVTGKITKTVDFGAFMEIEPGVEGLIHISQLSRRHVEKPEEVVTVNDEVEAKIININIDERRVGLSLKELEAPKQEKKESKPKRKRKKKSSNKKKNEQKESSGFSIGDMIGDDLSEMFEESNK